MWLPGKSCASGKIDWYTTLFRKLLKCIHSSDSCDRCYHWSQRWQTKLFTQPSYERFQVYLGWMDELQSDSGVARGGQGGDRPLWQKLCPPKWNYTLYRGLWRAAILSPGQPPLLTPQPPFPPPHFEKSGYAPAIWKMFVAEYSPLPPLISGELGITFPAKCEGPFWHLVITLQWTVWGYSMQASYWWNWVLYLYYLSTCIRKAVKN